MLKKKLLVDSCSYFRLAQTIHPLLGVQFGSTEKYILYLIEEFEREYMKSSQLRGKFGWVQQDQYVSNRKKHRIKTTAAEKAEIAEIFDHMSGFAEDEGLTTSPEDIRGVATAYVCKIDIVSDDKDLMLLATEFGVRCLKSLQLLEIMKNQNHVEIGIIRQIVGYWIAISDVPRDCRVDCETIFQIDYKSLG
jgi:hypothetical protein